MGSEIMPELDPYSSVSTARAPCWCSYVDLGPEYTTLHDFAQRRGVDKRGQRQTATALAISWLVLSLEGEALIGYCVFFWKEAREICWLKSLVGFSSSLTQQINQWSLCWYSRAVFQKKDYLGQGERFDEKKNTSDIQRSLSLQKLTHH